MKTAAIFTMLSLILLAPAKSQTIIMQEHFGAATWSGNPASYPDYTSDALFSGDDPHLFQVANSTGYTGASGGAAVLMGNWTTAANTDFVLQYNTEGQLSVQLAFGIKHNSNGWGSCQLTNNFTKIEYSTDSVNWTEMDKAQLLEGSSWPCAETQNWAFIRLAQILPSNATLYIRFTHTDPTIHPYYIDDVTLSAYEPDTNPPTAATNLRAENIGTGSFTMVWNASTDDGGVNHYKILKDGKYLLSSKDTIVTVRYQYPGSSAAFSVVAYDVAGNASEESALLNVDFLAKPSDYKYSWEKQQAKILPSGQIEWKPEGFEFVSGPSVRYIDYENGDDTNDGLSKSTPWKHHPWDAAATDVAAAESGIHTYVFKRGVVYRGKLTAKDSGTPVNPVRLTSDPSWGSGEALFFGSVRIEETWSRADETVAPNIPDPEKVWYVDVTLPATKMVCEIDGESMRELRVARSPNYQYTPDDPLKTWYKWTGKTEQNGALWLRDHINLTQTNPDYYQGATVFSQEDAIVMCTVWKQEVAGWDPENKRIKVADTNFGGVGSHYYIENTPFLLDTTSEFYYDQVAKRLFVRLEGDKDPNTTIIEAATMEELIRIENRHDIEISGISFGVTTAHKVRYGQEDAISAVRITGITNSITIKNNAFNYVVGGVSVFSFGSQAVNTHSITVSDNNFQNVADLAIVFAANSVYLDDINILRNSIYNNGYRHQGRWYGSIPAIYGQLNYGEVAGNIIDVSWGNGIDMFWGKGSGSDMHVPFIRGMIYQNSASNTLIGTNDYGGIESWQGGPTFCFNNNAHNASGYKHYNKSSIGYAYYFDGSFKHIVFNNIASGVSHNRNSAAIMQVLGYYNIYAHNSAYNTNIFFNAWKGTLALCGHNTYLANVAQDINHFFKHEISPSYIPYEAYGNNIAGGIAFNASLENLTQNLSLSSFQDKLEVYNSQLTQTGFNAAEDILGNAGALDFRAKADSEASGKGVKFFTAFPLARVVGEWNFYKHPADLSIIMADNFYMTEDFTNRDTYKDVPKNHLTAHNVTESSFVKGALEDWTDGALVFDGTVYCSVDHSVSSLTKSSRVDMTDNDFIIELFFRTEMGHTGGVLVSKYAGGEGYELSVNGEGTVEMTLYESGGATVSRAGDAVVNDSAWHHVLAEVNRNASIDIYIDGILSNGVLSGAMPAVGNSLFNSADLLVGKDNDDNFFRGAIDFLRISKGTLFDARTTVDEIYKWQNDGPFLYDMKGNAPDGIRDAGAIEAMSSCVFSVSDQSLEFENTSSESIITAAASDGITISDVEGDFINVTVDADTIIVSVNENLTIDERTGSFRIFGCGEAQEVTITQAGAPCYFFCETDTVKVNYNEQSVVVPLETNGSYTAGFIFESFIGLLSNSADSMTIAVEENTTSEERIAQVVIENCTGSHTITIVQDGLTGISNYYGDGGLKIYPNPVSAGNFNLLLPDGMQSAKYTISNLEGKALQNGLINKNSDFIQLNTGAGSYILSVEGKERVYRRTLIVL